MTQEQWIFVVGLAALALSIRVLGMLAGERIGQSSFAYLLDELPGLIVVSLIGASLAHASGAMWIAAGAAAVVAWRTNHVILTMIAGVGALILLKSVFEVL